MNTTKNTIQTAFLLSLVALQGATVCNPPQSTNTNNSLLKPQKTISITRKELLGQFKNSIKNSDIKHFESLLSRYHQEIIEHVPKLKQENEEKLKLLKKHKKVLIGFGLSLAAIPLTMLGLATKCDENDCNVSLFNTIVIDSLILTAGGATGFLANGIKSEGSIDGTSEIARILDRRSTAQSTEPDRKPNLPEKTVELSEVVVKFDEKKSLLD